MITKWFKKKKPGWNIELTSFFFYATMTHFFFFLYTRHLYFHIVMETECDSNDSVHCYGIICLMWSHFFFFQWYTLWIEQIKEAARKGIFMQCDKYIHRAGWCHNVSNLEVLARRRVASRDCSCSMEGSCLSLGNCLIGLFGCFF